MAHTRSRSPPLESAAEFDSVIASTTTRHIPHAFNEAHLGGSPNHSHRPPAHRGIAPSESIASNPSWFSTAEFRTVGEDSVHVSGTMPRIPNLGLSGLLDSPISSMTGFNSQPGQRRSMLRSGGTASHPDLATLVRSAKEKARKDKTITSAGFNPQGLEGASFSGPIDMTGTATATGEAVDRPRERRKTETSRRAPIPTFDRAAHPYGRNASTPLAQTAVSPPADAEPCGASTNEGTRTRSSSRGDSEGFVEVPGGGSSWSNTMRKTGSFFRRRFGSGARGAGPSHAPSGSIGDDDPCGSHAPPVPAIPASFRSTEPNLPSAPASAPPSGANPPEFCDQRTIRGDSMGHLSSDHSAPPTRRPSVQRASNIVAATAPAKAGPAPAPRRIPAPPKPKPKRDAMSNNTNTKSLPPSPHPLPLPDDAFNKRKGKGKARAMDDDHSRKPSLAQMSDASQSTTEEDRLKRDLKAWGLGADGVLGGSGGEAGTLDLRRSRSHTDPPPSPRTLTHRPATSPGPVLPSFANGARSKTLPLPMSTPTLGGDVARMPDWGQEETPRGRTKTEDMILTTSSRDLPPTPRSPLTPRGEEHEEGDWGTPSIRLVSSPTIARLHPGCSPPATQGAALADIDKDAAAVEHGSGGSNVGLGLVSGVDPGPPGAVATAHPRTMPLAEVLIKSAARKPEAQPEPARRGSSPSVVVSPADDSLVASGSGRAGRRLSMTANRQSVVQYPAAAVMTWTHTGSSKPRSVSGLSGLSAQSSFERDPDASSVLEGSGVPLEESARQLAARCWDEDESFMKREKISEWLGLGKPLNNTVLMHYMDKFDYAELRIDTAFRKLCDKLYLKGETQQVDRILEQFSRRFWDQNKSRVYASIDLVHAISYSLLLLNTDLHVVDSTTRMTRNQFVRNTMEVVHVQTGTDYEGRPLQDGPAETHPPPRSSNDNLVNSRPSMDKWRDHLHRGAGGAQKARRSASIVSWRSAAARGPVSSEPNPAEAEEPVGRVSGVSFDRAWEQEMEALLKDVYTSIKSQPIFQSAGSEVGSSPYGSWSGINRAASRRSHQSLGSTERSLTNKRTSLRGLGGLLAATSADSFRSSSPTPSAATSMSGTFSSNTMGSHPYTNLTSPSIGFASSLSHSIIREQQEDETSESGHSTSDEELALLGAPWAKEGLLQRKHYWESLGKRAKDKTWTRNFVVIQRGELRMFKFGESGASGTMAGMGGGNWMANAQAMGEMTLAHALCSAMPAGYNRERPHTFVLTLSSGSSYFFQAGTADLVNEWVSTSNYWAARLSREPLTGGVSNMEYGWNRVLPEADRDDGSDREELASVLSGVSAHSYRSRRSKMSFQTPNMLNSNDRIFINDWKPPQSPSTASTLSEDGQLEALRRHVEHMQRELEQHNTLRKPMTKLYTPRSVNAQKSLANWERKSQFLLSEIVKYTTYIEALESAIRLRNQRRDEKQISKLLSAADDNDVDYIDIDGSARTPNDSLSSSGQLDATPRAPPGNRPESAGPSVSTHKTSDSSQPYFDAMSTSPKSSSPH